MSDARFQNEFLILIKERLYLSSFSFPCFRDF